MDKQIDRHPKYFEGILQLRNPTQQIIDFVADTVDSKSDVWIARTVKQKDGVDIFLSSNKFLREIGRMLKTKFHGELLESKRIFTRNSYTSKDVYRGCILFKHYDVKKGDILTIRGDEIEVLGVGKYIMGRYVSNHQKVRLKFDQLR
jgi:NMD protein affecting ribosome stability and mRNA decay